MVLSRAWLKSKITKPAYPVTVVKRMRLYDKLAGWQEKRAIVVSAPSGYGKSTLISHWIDFVGLRERAAWLSLDEGDVDPREFVGQLAAALDVVVPGVLGTVQPILDDVQGDADRVVRRLLSALEDEDDLMLVLDDVQRVESPQINAVIADMLEIAPASLHLILIARSRPQIPLARLFAHGAITVLETDDLRFTQAEIRTYLAGMGYPSVSDAETARLAEECEGWVAALQMGVLSTPMDGDVSGLIASLDGGGSDWVAHYLADEVLSRQGEEIRRFLLRTSILESFDAQLAAAVTGMDNAAALLADIVRSGLFVIEIASNPEQKWYRYHHLFQDLLQARLKNQMNAKAIADLHRRAAVWLADKGDVFSAVAHFLAAGDVDSACVLVENSAYAIMLQDPYRARRLLNTLPETQFVHRPRLSLLRCRLSFLLDGQDLEHFTAQASDTLSRLPQAEGDSPRYWAEYLVYRSAVLFRRRSFGAMHETMAEAGASTHLMDDFTIAAFHFLHVHLSFYQGNETEAVQHGERALDAYQAINANALAISVQRELASWALRRGHADEAIRRIRSIREDHLDSSAMSTREYTIAALIAAETCYWINDLACARTYQQEMARLANTLQDDQLIYLAELLLGSYTDAGKYDGEAFKMLSPGGLMPVFRDWAVHIAVRSLLAVGDVESVEQLATRLGLFDEIPPPHASDSILSSYVLAFIASGKDLASLTPLLEDALANRRRIGYRLGELHVLSMMAWQQLRLRGELAATAVLIEANKLAQQTGYVRILRNIPELAPLLDKVYAFADGDPAPQENTVSLTEQEQQVLILLDADRTYPEIAEALTITVNTVRTHVRNLYRKLGVHRRAQALETARDLGLLPRN